MSEVWELTRGTRGRGGGQKCRQGKTSILRAYNGAGKKLTSSSNLPAFPNFATVRRDRPTGGGGGLITLVHHSVAFTEVNTNHLFPGDSTAEHLAIEVDIDGAKLLVVNVYIPPISSCPTGYTPNLTHLFSSTDDTLAGCPPPDELLDISWIMK